MKINAMEFLIFILIFSNLSCISLSKDRQYYDAMEDVKSGSLDFAFMKFNNYLREHPNSTYAPKIRFAISEYYFQTKDYRDAIDELTKYIINYPNEKNTIFAQAIFYKALLDYRTEPLLVEKLKEAFFSKSIFLIFSDSKTKSYKSILNNNYKIVDYIDKIEVFKNDELLFEIAP